MKYIPQRTCVVCKNKQPKNNLIRIVEQNETFVIDNFQKISARGFYICNNINCANNISKKRVLSRLYKTNIAQEKHQNLENLLINYLNNKK